LSRNSRMASSLEPVQVVILLVAGTFVARVLHEETSALRESRSYLRLGALFHCSVTDWPAAVMAEKAKR